MKREARFRAQRPKRLFAAAGRGATRLSNTRKREKPLLKVVLLQQQRLAWAKRNHLK